MKILHKHRCNVSLVCTFSNNRSFLCWEKSASLLTAESQDCFWIRVRSGKFKLKISMKSGKYGLFFVQPSFSTRQNRLNIEHKCHQSPHIIHIVTCHHGSAIWRWKLTEHLTNSGCIIIHHIGVEIVLQFGEKCGILLLPGCCFPTQISQY